MASPIDSHLQTTVIPVLVETIDIEHVVYETGAVRIRKVVHHDVNAAPYSNVQEVVETTRLPVNQVVETTVVPHQRGDTPHPGQLHRYSPVPVVHGSRGHAGID